MAEVREAVRPSLLDEDVFRSPGQAFYSLYTDEMTRPDRPLGEARSAWMRCLNGISKR
jgi:hypothetical protein